MSRTEGPRFISLNILCTEKIHLPDQCEDKCAAAQCDAYV